MNNEASTHLSSDPQSQNVPFPFLSFQGSPQQRQPVSSSHTRVQELGPPLLGQFMCTVPTTARPEALPVTTSRGRRGHPQ